MKETDVEAHVHPHAPSIGRRDFLCRCGAGGMATAAMLAGINRPALAGQLTIKKCFPIQR